MFNRLTCDVFNANDVLFSTASLLNLCCISMDRYIAITDPFNYSVRMSKRKIIITTIAVWMASILVSHLPIHLKLYATSVTSDDEMECSFQVNVYYGIISSLVSFWTPAIVMLFTYKKIFSEAQRQVKQIESLRPKTPPSPNILLNEFNSKEMLKGCSHERMANKNTIKNTIPSSSPPASDGSNRSNNSNIYASPRLSVSSNHLIVGNQCKRKKNNCSILKTETLEQGLLSKKSLQPNFKRSFTNIFQFDSKSQATTNENRRRIKKEHKAAKTLGIIMGVFLGCWLPFFTWYLTSSICQDYCYTPKVVVSVLFWVGYTNSALNPIIYACFNREFRGAFRRQLCYYRPWMTYGRNLEIVVGSDKNWRWSNDVSSNKKEEVWAFSSTFRFLAFHCHKFLLGNEFLETKIKLIWEIFQKCQKNKLPPISCKIISECLRLEQMPGKSRTHWTKDNMKHLRVNVKRRSSSKNSEKFDWIWKKKFLLSGITCHWLRLHKRGRIIHKFNPFEVLESIKKDSKIQKQFSIHRHFLSIRVLNLAFKVFRFNASQMRHRVKLWIVNIIIVVDVIIIKSLPGWFHSFCDQSLCPFYLHHL